MTPVAVLLAASAYVVLLMMAAHVAGRRTDNAGFFAGNRRSPWYVVAMAMVGASISGVTFVSVPGMVATQGMGYLQMVLGFVAGQAVIAYVLTPLFYRLNLTSVYGYLEQRMGTSAWHTGAWLFFVSKLLGAAVRLLLLCTVLQLLAWGPLGVPFGVGVAIVTATVWLYTRKGGVKAVVWTDVLRTVCLVGSVAGCIVCIAREMGLTLSTLVQTVADSPMSRIFYCDDPNSKQFLAKQFLAGMFTMIATNGLDQDMMQRNLSCRNHRESQKNMMTSICVQTAVIGLFLVLGVLMYQFAAARGISVERGDDLFPRIATCGLLPLAVGIMFVVGLTASALSAAGSALTALTTSFTVDIVGIEGRSEARVAALRRKIHIAMALLMGVTVYVVGLLNNTSVIDAVYTLVGYTYGPILGLFAFGIGCRRQVRSRFVPWIATAAPLICLGLQLWARSRPDGYQLGYELLILNAALTCAGLALASRKQKADPSLSKTDS